MLRLLRPETCLPNRQVSFGRMLLFVLPFTVHGLYVCGTGRFTITTASRNQTFSSSICSPWCSMNVSSQRRIQRVRILNINNLHKIYFIHVTDRLFAVVASRSFASPFLTHYRFLCADRNYEKGVNGDCKRRRHR